MDIHLLTECHIGHGNVGPEQRVAPVTVDYSGLVETECVFG